MVISHGYETSISGLRKLRPRGSAWFKKRHCIGNLFGFPTLILLRDARNLPTINKGQEARESRMAALHLGTGQPFGNGPHQALHRDSARGTPLRNIVHDHGVKDRLHHLGGVGVLSVSRSHTKVEARTKDEVNLNTTPRSLDKRAHPSTSKSPLGMAKGYTPSSPGEETWVSLSLSSIDNSHASMMSHLSFRKSNIRLSLVSLLMSLSFAASLITMA
ncbi:hypothetical protein Cgig2_025437 [Carnegiea gigantea]|uniref:Uncharacterized protein n=1 Tax=Carnegiea gigantea TaxID=171969 RepID=A0A9Q1QNZ2_9CARY|nr:hypothetical protein Cgig2_025437 [Carnegiea gigantea]